MRKSFYSRMVLLLTIALASSNAIAKTPKRVNLPATSVILDSGANLYFDKISRISNASDCFPIHISQNANVGIFYQYCSEVATEADYQPVKITDNFSTPEGIAARFNFWRRVYSLWSKDTYVLHSAVYPEVVLEVGDFSRIIAGDKAKNKIAQNFFKQAKAEYRKILVSLYQNRHADPSTLPPTMRRIAKLMERIDDKDKYLKAANALRVQRGQRDFIAAGFGMASRYLPAIEKEFENQGVPVELSRLAFVESSFNLLAESKVGASGVFQLMKPTALQYRLKITDSIDERNDPVKAARAAAKLLKLNYTITGSWPLAVTSYNHGVNGVRKAVARAGSRDITYLIKNYTSKSFGFASKNFYSSYLAMLATLKQADKIFPNVETFEPIRFFNVRLPHAMTFAEIRKQHKLTNEEIIIYNHDLSRRFVRNNGMLPTGYILKVPDRSPKTEVAFSAFIP